jgi:hypothetical protein
MIGERQAEDANDIAIGGRTHAKSLHRPGQAIDEAALDELQRIAFLPGDGGREWLPQQPAAKNVAPVSREWVRFERIEGENSLCDAGDRRDGSLVISNQKCGVRLHKKVVGLRRHRVERVTRFETQPRKKIAAARDGGRIGPDEAAPGDERCTISGTRPVIEALQAAVPEGGLKDRIKRGFDLVIGNIGFADQAKAAAMLTT